MRIIGINGIRCYDCPVLRRLRPAFEREFAPDEYVIEEDTGCGVWQLSRMRRFAQEIQEKHDDGSLLLLIGYSMGGIQACSIATGLTRSKVAGIVTIFAPHTMFAGVFPRIIGPGRLPQAPIISFHGARDPYVRWGTQHPASSAHIILDSDHYRDLLQKPNLADTIARESKKFLYGARRI